MYPFLIRRLFCESVLDIVEVFNSVYSYVLYLLENSHRNIWLSVTKKSGMVGKKVRSQLQLF